MDQSIVQLAIASTPEIIDLLKSLFGKANPDAPPLTDADAKAALVLALSTSLAIDAGYLAAHPDA